jgi:hypothetical protein
MPQSLLADADGRIHRARRPIRKLAALGLTDDDVLDLLRRFRNQRQAVRATDLRSHDPNDRDERLHRAQEAIRTLIALGFPECDIAELAGVHASTITHMLDPFEARIVGSDTVQKLQEALALAGTERLNALLPRLPVKVLDTCCDKGRMVDKVTSEELEARVRAVLRSLLLRTVAGTDVLAPGVTGVLAQVGEVSDGVTVLVAPCSGPATPERRLARLKALEHEAEHLLQRYRDERQQLEKQCRGARAHALPKDGTIA